MAHPWLLVAGDFTPLGGMDRANHALALYLASSGRDVHVVTHRAWPDLASRPTVSVHLVRRPFGRHLLGSPMLALAGRRRVAAACRPTARAPSSTAAIARCRSELGALPPRRSRLP